MQSHVCVLHIIWGPTEIKHPKCRQQKAQKRGAPWDQNKKKLITELKVKDNPDFPHIVYLSNHMLLW